MAVAQKIVLALEHITHGGKIFEPGARLDGRLPKEALESVLAHGHATEHEAAGEQAAKGEAERKADVAKQQQTRSEKRVNGE